jgi:predicted RNA-binding Zn-ribbon protein involved in translation (DUF1610 family)
MRQVKETRATCKACGHVWHYTWDDRVVEVAGELQCCPCCLPFQAKPKVGTEKCPKCGSSAISRETVVHEVDQ